MYFIHSIETTDDMLLIESRRSLWELVYASAIIAGCLGYYGLSLLDDEGHKPVLLYCAGAIAGYALTIPFGRCLTLIDRTQSELVREFSWFVTLHRRALSLHASAVRLQREVWYGGARHDHFYRILASTGGKDMHLGRVKSGSRAWAIAGEIAQFLNVEVLDTTDQVMRVFPIFGGTLARHYDQTREVV